MGASQSSRTKLAPRQEPSRQPQREPAVDHGYHKLSSGPVIHAYPVLPSAPSAPNSPSQYKPSQHATSIEPIVEKIVFVPNTEDGVLAAWTDLSVDTKIKLATTSLKSTWWKVLARLSSENLLPSEFVKRIDMAAGKYFGCLEFARSLPGYKLQPAITMQLALHGCIDRDSNEVRIFLMSLMKVPGQLTMMPWGTVAILVYLRQSEVLEFYVQNLTGADADGATAGRLLEATFFIRKHAFASLLQSKCSFETGVAMANSLAFLLKRGSDTLSPTYGHAEIQQLEAKLVSGCSVKDIEGPFTYSMIVLGIVRLPLRLCPHILELVCSNSVRVERLETCDVILLGAGKVMGNMWKLVQRVLSSWSSADGNGQGIELTRDGVIMCRLDILRHLIDCVIAHTITFPESYPREDAVAELEPLLKWIMDSQTYLDVIMCLGAEHNMAIDVIMKLLDQQTDNIENIVKILTARSTKAPGNTLMYHFYVSQDVNRFHQCFQLLLKCRADGYMLDELSRQAFTDTLKLACVRGELATLCLFADSIGVGEDHWIDLYKNHASVPTQLWMRKILSLGAHVSFRESVLCDIATQKTA